MFIGHEKNWALLTKVYPKLSPFLIFYGEKGIGKNLFAKYFSSFILGKTVEQLEQGICQTFRYLSFKEGEIKIEILPMVRDFLEYRYADYKILIIDNADDLNNNAANSLLKLFEKEYEKTFVILIVHNIDKFPTTLRSRFFEVPFEGAVDFNNPLSEYTQGNLGLLKWVEKQGGISFIEHLKNLMKFRSIEIDHENFIKKYKDDYLNILQLMKIILFLEQNTKAFEKLNQFMIRSEHTHISLEDNLYMGFLSVVGG